MQVTVTIGKKSRLDLLAEVEEIIERDGETCAMSLAIELGIDIKQVACLVRVLLKSQGIYEGDLRTIGGNKVQFYTLIKPRYVQQSLISEPAKRDPLVEFLFGKAK